MKELSEREKWLMRNAWALSDAGFYETLDDWLSAAAGDTGYTVERQLAYDAEQRHPANPDFRLEQARRIAMYGGD